LWFTSGSPPLDDPQQGCEGNSNSDGNFAGVQGLHDRHGHDTPDTTDQDSDHSERANSSPSIGDQTSYVARFEVGRIEQD
jgi:hypothetical protein